MNRVSMLRDFVAQRPLDPFPRYGLAIELKNQGSLDESDREFEELMTRFPEYTAAYLHAGNVRRDLGRLEDAAETYRRGITACLRHNDSHAQGELEAALAALANPDSEEE